MKQLIIAEKPSVAQNIAVALNVVGRKDGYTPSDRRKERRDENSSWNAAGRFHGPFCHAPASIFYGFHR